MRTTLDLSGAEWVKSSFSGNGGAQCVEWAPLTAAATGIVAVRDSKHPHDPALLFTSEAWSSFVAAVSSGELPSV